MLCRLINQISVKLAAGCFDRPWRRDQTAEILLLSFKYLGIYSPFAFPSQLIYSQWELHFMRISRKITLVHIILRNRWEARGENLYYFYSYTHAHTHFHKLQSNHVFRSINHVPRPISCSTFISSDKKKIFSTNLNIYICTFSIRHLRFTLRSNKFETTTTEPISM